MAGAPCAQYAVEGLSDALADELAPLGIKVTMVQPGPTATAFLDNLDVAAAIDDYDRTVREVQKAIGAQPASAYASPARIAAGIRAAADSDAPPLRLALGASARTPCAPPSPHAWPTWTAGPARRVRSTRDPGRRERTGPGPTARGPRVERSAYAVVR